MTETRQMLLASVTPKPEIAAKAGVSLRWLYMFANGETTNPTLRTLRSLRSYLATESQNHPS